MFTEAELARATEEAKQSRYEGPLAGKWLADCTREELLVIALNGWHSYRGAIDGIHNLNAIRNLKPPTFAERFFGRSP